MIYLNISRLVKTNNNTILSKREWEKIMKGKNLEQYSNVTGFEKLLLENSSIDGEKYMAIESLLKTIVERLPIMN